MIKFYKIFIIIFTIGIFSNIPLTAYSDEDLKYLKPKFKNTLSLGGGFIYKPTYYGSSSIRTVWFPSIYYNYENKENDIFKSFSIMGPFASLELYNSKNFSFNILGEYDFGRQKGDDNSLTHTKDIDPHFNTGLEIGYKIPYDLALEVAYKTEATSFGDDMILEYSLSHNKYFWVNFTQPVINKLSLTTSYANKSWMNEWFSTYASADYSQYDAKGGFYSTKLSNMSIIPAGESISLFLNIEYEKLQGNAADSPLVKDQGSKTQYKFMFVVLFKIAEF